MKRWAVSVQFTGSRYSLREETVVVDAGSVVAAVRRAYNDVKPRVLKRGQRWEKVRITAEPIGAVPVPSDPITESIKRKMYGETNHDADTGQ